MLVVLDEKAGAFSLSSDSLFTSTQEKKIPPKTNFLESADLRFSALLWHHYRLGKVEVC
jgi:hypothetical protein